MEFLMRLTYWGGWGSMVVAFLYKLLIRLNVITGLQAQYMGALPRHFWELSFLLFLSSLATYGLVRMKSA